MTTPPPYYGPPQGQPVPPAGGQQNTQGLVGMIVGIVSIPLACCAWGGIVLGVVGLVFSWLGLQKSNQGLASNRGQAMAGLICSAVGLVLGILILILSFSLQSFDWQHYVESNSN